jgi:DNA-directed RNA polymerase subunit D
VEEGEGGFEMQLEVSKCTNKELQFTVKGVPTALVNAVRRVGMSQIQTFGIDNVTFYENTSSLFDEYIANRIGLVPILSPDGYSEKDVILFSLDKSGPVTVYSKNLRSVDAKVKIANKDIPIIKLSEGQHLRVEAKARLGTAKEHARFQPGVIAYEKDGDSFNVVMESFGQMTPKEILVKSSTLLEGKLKEMKEALKKVKKKKK